MTIRIGSNISSLTAQRRLGEADSALSKSFERLASGQRINRASDDAAGLAIADDLKAKGRIYTQAIRNGNDGISLLNIADSAIDALSGIVTRIRELSEQSANGTYSDKQREALDAEAQALSKEFTRITQTTSFNGLKLFSGSLGDGVRLQLGNGLSESINASVGGAVGTGTVSSNTILATTSIAADASNNAVSLGDLNNDGILDLVTVGKYNNEGQASVSLGIGDGTFGARTVYQTAASTSGGTANSFALSLGDVNGDGILDIVTAGAAMAPTGYQGQASVLIGRGDGTFSSKVTYSTETSSELAGNSKSTALSLGDVNGDGILDLVTAGYVSSGGSYQGRASILLGTGNGTFVNQISVTTHTSTVGNAKSFGLDLADIDNDGDLDLVTVGNVNIAGTYESQAAVLLGSGNGTFGSKRTVSTGFSAFGGSHGRAVSMGDLNGDGILDLVAAGYVLDAIGNVQGQASVSLGLGDGSFGSQVLYSTETSATSQGVTWALKLGDLNGDGILDLVTGGYANDNLGYQGKANILIGQGDGRFVTNATFKTNTSNSNQAFTRALALGDLNGDGVTDLVAVGSAFNASNYQGQASILLARTQDGLGAIQDFSLKTKSDALQSMGMLDRTLENLAKQRGTIGASQSRVNIAISNLQTSRENLAAAESRIRDADIASEAGNLVRTQILQQAATSVLSQANQSPALALQLLR